MERTFIMVKPDGVQRGFIGEIVSRFERKGFKLVSGKLMIIAREQAERHYAEHAHKPFFGELVDFITSGPVFAMIWEGDDVISLSRLMIGKTKVGEALPGTIRGDYASHTNFNLVHGSDSPESAAREIANMFSEQELVSYERAVQPRF
ncbi:nucleoside-diphosphate kinase [Paenibacillus apiarius]|uniref:Nucleoside diphosphate kinase n=1 Tax=Paenibacillus apiarius TaxID=46240 RepID=A0ABT4DSG2_9BACL|nr:nucleoside-diphosphate kinase [Paenibacillus apiarius]MCY9517113.1 nucleoside-diphosphate kinase [Paenibacillus apiarius]MCY9520190.1 nucleoside-diphosphate kinase [Paenibacillus apiarius]MCY9554922.1 nucleoside-diphosphate kinase [Paenibacillus apiarius]MCY9561433.1 nucleoside-diphosphate kinase [Paenibacillus apiarius]MCY9685955.1 nucleoside-diphosphate kinase [Paenibacillus apiarius]